MKFRFIHFQVSLSQINAYAQCLEGKYCEGAGARVAQFLELIQALNFYHELTQSHLLKFAKKESLDLVHRIILSDHRSINLSP